MTVGRWFKININQNQLLLQEQDFSRKLQFDKFTKEEYIDSCGFTTLDDPSEMQVFELRSKGASVVSIALQLHSTTRTIERRLKSIKRKIIIYEFKKALLN